jgi:hypothetical protein
MEQFVFLTGLLVWSLNRKLSGDKQINTKFQEYVFVNKLDRTGADFYRCIDMIQRKTWLQASSSTITCWC